MACSAAVTAGSLSAAAQPVPVAVAGCRSSQARRMCSSSVSSSAGTTASVPRRGRSSSPASRSTAARSSGCWPRSRGQVDDLGQVAQQRMGAGGIELVGAAERSRWPRSVPSAYADGAAGVAVGEPRVVRVAAGAVSGVEGLSASACRARGAGTRRPRASGTACRPDEPSTAPAGRPGSPPNPAPGEPLCPRGAPADPRRARPAGPHDRDHVAEHVHPATVARPETHDT